MLEGEDKVQSFNIVCKMYELQ
uniref:Uncharacterized protein n=1 Tax=Rhizophora mucronata TaxID=61149 RepID=A0A2P2QAZ8_RHIMU